MEKLPARGHKKRKNSSPAQLAVRLPFPYRETMNEASPIRRAERTSEVRIGHTACPHDCPSTCALDVELLGPDRIGRVRGAPDNSYTAGVICAKVARYSERIHHPDRLLYPLRRTAAKGEGNWTRITWDEALDEISEKFLAAEDEFGTQSVWPYFYAGTMGHVHRDGINRLRNAKSYSEQYDTICTMISWTGYIAGTSMAARAQSS